MGKFAISFFYITILLAISVKYTTVFIPSSFLNKQEVTDQKDKSEKSESSEEEKDSKDDLKKNEFLNNQSDYFIGKVSSKPNYGDRDASLPSIFQIIQKLPPKTC